MITNTDGSDSEVIIDKIEYVTFTVNNFEEIACVNTDCTNDNCTYIFYGIQLQCYNNQPWRHPWPAHYQVSRDYLWIAPGYQQPPWLVQPLPTPTHRGH